MSISINPDALASLASYVAREWGDYGYRFESIEACDWRGVVHVGHIVASDGSRFMVCVDRWGNVRDVPESDGWREIAAEMYSKATAA